MSVIVRQPEPEAIEASPPSRRDWQAMSMVVGGLIFATGNLLHPLQHNDAAYDATTWSAAHLTILASLPFLVVGLPAVHRALVTRVNRRLATFAVVASVVGLIGLAPGMVIEAFVAPSIGHEAMAELEAGGMGLVNAIFGLAFLGGAAALGWSAFRARLRPSWAGPSLLAAAIAMVSVMDSSGRIAGVVIVAATALYGIALAALGAGVDSAGVAEREEPDETTPDVTRSR